MNSPYIPLLKREGLLKHYKNTPSLSANGGYLREGAGG